MLPYHDGLAPVHKFAELYLPNSVLSKTFRQFSPPERTSQKGNRGEL